MDLLEKMEHLLRSNSKALSSPQLGNVKFGLGNFNSVILNISFNFTKQRNMLIFDVIQLFSYISNAFFFVFFLLKY